MSITNMVVKHFLKKAGIRVNGPESTDPQTENVSQFLSMIGNEGVMGLGDWYTAGKWKCADLVGLVGFYHKVVSAGLYEFLMNDKTALWFRERYEKKNLQATPEISAKNAHDHYGKLDQIIRLMLDPRLTYTCARWKQPDNMDDDETLESAQEHKLGLIYRDLNLEPGMTVLDVGCGYGSFLGYAAERGVKAYGITPVQQQVDYIEKRYGSTVNVKKLDFRDVKGQYNALLSVGVASHIGKKNFPEFMAVKKRCLKPGGVALLHLISCPNDSVPLPGPWIQKYIFPGGECLTPLDVITASQPHFHIQKVVNIGYHYGKTLVHWLRRAEPVLRKMEDQETARMIEHYLACCPAMFWTQRLNVLQYVFTHGDFVYNDIQS